MGGLPDLPPRPCISQTIAALKELHLARAALIKDRSAAKNRAKMITLPRLEKQNKKLIAEIDAKIEKLIRDDALPARRFESLLSIPGVPAITAFALLIEMPELGSLEGKQAASSPASRPSQDNPAHGKATPLFAAAGHSCAKLFICQRSPLADSTKIAARSIKNSPRQESQQKSPSPPLCASSSSSPTRFCAMTEFGAEKPLAHNGCSKFSISCPSSAQ
jgi:hypothetical protein